MCGIAGIIGKGWDPSQLEAMVSIQNHRGPDDSGIYIDETGQVGLGHNRLSIIDLSPAGHQPMRSQDGRLWVVFNGEIYNYRELRVELSDYPYQSQTDTEVILAAYQSWGEKCVEHFIGMFSFALWDEENQQLFCARDRLGIKPFHYALHEGYFLFSSEIKAILAAGHPAETNWTSWSTYLAHGYYDHGDAVFFAGICTLPPGHTLTLSEGQMRLHCYWDLPSFTAEPLLLSDDEAAVQMLSLLEDAVRLRLRSDVPLGVNLSGGLDSASMMVLVDHLMQTEGQVQTFTASFDDPKYDEYEFADDVPRQTRWVRHRQRLHPDQVWDMAWEALWHQEAPFGGISTLIYHHLHQLAKERGVIVLLEGQGVDEMLAGYRYFRPYYYLDLLEQGNSELLHDELQASGENKSSMMAQIHQLRNGSGMNVYQDGTNYLRPDCLVPEIRQMAGEQPQFRRPFATHLNNALYRDLRYTKLPRVLRMNDRLSMAFSRELREPYLDHKLVEFLFRLPGNQKIRQGRNKYLLRHATARRLPDELRLASKRAIVSPQREWLRNQLRPLVEDVIHSNDFTQRGIFDPVRVKQEYTRFCQGKGDNAFFVWQWVNTELWFHRFVDGHGKDQ